MGLRNGKTTLILLTGVAFAALCVWGVFLFRRDVAAPTDPASVSEPQANAPAPVSDGEMSAAETVVTIEPAVPNVFTDDDAQRLTEAHARLQDVQAQIQRVERELQGARYAALKSNPEFKAQLDQSQALKRDVTALIARLPERIQLDRQRDRSESDQIKAVERINMLKKRIADARADHEKALAEGKPPTVEESDMRVMLAELQQAGEDERELRSAVASYVKEVKKLEMRCEQSHPVISVKAAEAERIRRELDSAISESVGVAPIVSRRDALFAEREALVKECAGLGSRSNRVAAAAQGEGNR